jgi:hypothetical protein
MAAGRRAKKCSFLYQLWLILSQVWCKSGEFLKQFDGKNGLLAKLGEAVRLAFRLGRDAYGLDWVF